MFDNYVLLQQYWWFLVSLLGALLVMLMFVQGGQSLLQCIGTNETEYRMLTNSTGRKWELTFTTLVTFGGAFFASFPLFYSTSFGGAYWVWMLILLCFVIQAISYEFQSKKQNVLGKKTYRFFLLLNGVLAPILIGTAVGTFFHGAEFVVNKSNMTNIGAPVISQWANILHGLEAVLNPWNVCLGAAVLFLSRVLARLYFINNIDHAGIEDKCRRHLPIEAGIFLVFFLAFLIHLLCTTGFAVNPETAEISLEPYKYLSNLLAMPAVLIVLLLGVVAVLGGIIMGSWTKSRAGIWYTGLGSVLAVLSLLLLAGWNNTSYYPSLVDLQSSLTLANSCSSLYTLKVMTIVSFIIPFVLAYIFYMWRLMDAKSITAEEMEADEHGY